MKLVLIPPGEFDMGSPKELIESESQSHSADRWYIERLAGEGPRHRVRITNPYWLGVREVTQDEYQRVMGGNPSRFQGDLRRPIENVSWNDALDFCRKLSELPGEKVAKRRYRLPTEAQWECACRAGSTGRWCFSPQPNAFPAAVEERMLGEYAWLNTNASGATHPVGQKRAGIWGLHDTYGNVMEWCQDWYDKGYYTNSPVDDPVGPPNGSIRVIRGGCWSYPVWYCRLAFRSVGAPGLRSHDVGFRVAMVLEGK